MVYPVNLELDGRLCVVIGGGTVALRKVQGVLAGGGTVRVISPKAVEGLHRLAQQGAVEWRQRPYVEGDLEGAFLAFAATSDPQVQDRALEEANGRDILINCATDPIGSGFHVPAHVRRGRLLVTVSTGGGSPALSKRLRRELQGSFDPRYGLAIDLLALLRARVMVLDNDSAAHGVLFRRLLDGRLVELVLAADWPGLRDLLVQELPPAIDGEGLLRAFLAEHGEGEGAL